MIEIKGLFLKDKKAEEKEVMYDAIIFTILTIVFFSLLLFFVHKTSTGAVVYEQFYAKQIALMIDNAKPNTKILLDFEEGIKVAEENKITSKENLVKIENNKVFVKLSGKDGYSMDYFSNYKVSYSFEEKNLVIFIINKEEIQNVE